MNEIVPIHSKCLQMISSFSQFSYISGNFGTSVASFFTFLRWLCALNLILTFLVISFLLVPQSLVGHGLEVPDSIRENVSAVSFIIDGKVCALIGLQCVLKFAT